MRGKSRRRRLIYCMCTNMFFRAERRLHIHDEVSTINVQKFFGAYRYLLHEINQLRGCKHEVSNFLYIKYLPEKNYTCVQISSLGIRIKN